MFSSLKSSIACFSNMWPEKTKVKGADISSKVNKKQAENQQKTHIRRIKLELVEKLMELSASRSTDISRIIFEQY